jgi:hypothetical protein
VDADDRFIGTKGDSEGDIKDIVHSRSKLSCPREIHRRGDDRRLDPTMVYNARDVNEWTTLNYDDSGSTY